MIKDDNPRVIVPPPQIFAAFLGAGLIMDHNLASTAVLQLSAVASIVAGLAFIAGALGLFRKAHTRPEPWQASTALVITGVYRFTRNPMYLGMTLVCFGVAILFSSLAATLSMLVAVLIIDRAVISREEAYLARRFGRDYLAYRSRVRRWL